MAILVSNKLTEVCRLLFLVCSRILDMLESIIGWEKIF